MLFQLTKSTNQTLQQGCATIDGATTTILSLSKHPPLALAQTYHVLIRQSLTSCKRSLLTVITFSLFIDIAMLVPAIYMLQVYDRVVSSGSTPTLYMLSLLMLFFLAAMGMLEWARSDIMRRIGNRLDMQFAPLLFDIGFRQALYSDGVANGAQPLNDLKGLRQFISSNGLFAFFDLPWVPIYLLLMFGFNIWVGLAGLLSTLVLLGITLLNERVTQQRLKESEREYTDAAGSIQRIFRNGEAINAMGMLGRLRARWLDKTRSALILQNKASDASSVFISLSKTLRIVIQSLILGLGALLTIKQEISPGMMIAGSILLGRALAPIDHMLGTWKQFINAREELARLNHALNNDFFVESQLPLPPPKGDIRAENITVKAPGGNLALLKNVSFHCLPGTITGIIGPSAAGKSTLARALLGIWPCASGAVRLDGADIFSWRKEELGPYIGYLPQDIEIFEGTVSENIARFGEHQAEKIIQAAMAAGIHDMILRLPRGYDTPLGAAGNHLSGGQKQRIGIARAIYGMPKLIVLDEPNSNLDNQGETALLNTLQRLKQEGSTVFVITHKMSALNAVDQLLVMQEGSIAIFGPRDLALAELSKQNQIALQNQPAREGSH